jgi:hypothetical protein
MLFLRYAWPEHTGSLLSNAQVVDTGEIVPVKNPHGLITYGNDGRMMVIIVRHPRPKPVSIEKATDEDAPIYCGTMTAYAGTYKFDGE